MASAQVFIGGNLNVNTGGGKFVNEPASGTSTTVDYPKAFGFQLAPKVGFFLSEDMAFGASVNFGINSSKVSATNSSTNATTIGVAPFFRYYVVNGEKFKLFGEATLGLESVTNKATVAGVTSKGPKNGITTFSVTPNVAYSITENIDLEARLNFFGINYTSNTTKTEDNAGNKTKDVNNGLNLGFNTNTIFTSGLITVGAIYKL